MPKTSTPASYTMRVDSNPKGATIYLNGQFKGVTPTTITGLKGTYSLRLNLSGYYDHTDTVNVTKHESVSYILNPIVCTLKIESEPEGAFIYINNQLRGNTPAIITGPKGKYSLRLTLKGYRDYTATVEVAGLTEVSCKLNLAKDT